MDTMMKFGLGLIAILVGVTVIAAIAPLILRFASGNSSESIVQFGNTSQFGPLGGVVNAVFPILLSVAVVILLIAAIKTKGGENTGL